MALEAELVAAVARARAGEATAAQQEAPRSTTVWNERKYNATEAWVRTEAMGAAGMEVPDDAHAQAAAANAAFAASAAAAAAAAAAVPVSAAAAAAAADVAVTAAWVRRSPASPPSRVARSVPPGYDPGVRIDSRIDTLLEGTTVAPKKGKTMSSKIKRLIKAFSPAKPKPPMGSPSFVPTYTSPFRS